MADIYAVKQKKKKMSQLQAAIEFQVELSKFHNVDLFQRGFYQVRTTFKHASKLTAKVEVQLIKSSGGSSNLLPTSVSGTSVTSKMFQILYRKEEIEINDVILFKVNMLVDVNKIEESIAEADFQLLVELLFTEDEFKNGVGPVMASISERELKLHLTAGSGLHHHVPLLFDYFHLAALFITVHASLLALHAPYITKHQSGAVTIQSPSTQSSQASNDYSMQTILFGSSNNNSATNKTAAGSRRHTHRAQHRYRQICRSLLSAYESLQSSLDSALTRLPQATRNGIEFKAIDCHAKLEELCTRCQTFTERGRGEEEEDLFELMQGDISTLSGQNLILWSQFREIVTLNQIITRQLANEHHTLRVKRFSEGFIVNEFLKPEAIACFDASLHGHADIANQIRSSEYYQLIRPLPIECVDVDGDYSTIPVIFEDVYTEPQAILIQPRNSIGNAQGFSGGVKFPSSDPKNSPAFIRRGSMRGGMGGAASPSLLRSTLAREQQGGVEVRHKERHSVDVSSLSSETSSVVKQQRRQSRMKLLKSIRPESILRPSSSYVTAELEGQVARDQTDCTLVGYRKVPSVGSEAEVVLGTLTPSGDHEDRSLLCDNNRLSNIRTETEARSSVVSEEVDRGCLYNAASLPSLPEGVRACNSLGGSLPELTTPGVSNLLRESLYRRSSMAASAAQSSTLKPLERNSGNVLSRSSSSAFSLQEEVTQVPAVVESVSDNIIESSGIGSGSTYESNELSDWRAEDSRRSSVASFTNQNQDNNVSTNQNPDSNILSNQVQDSNINTSQSEASTVCVDNVTVDVIGCDKETCSDSAAMDKISDNIDINVNNSDTNVNNVELNVNKSETNINNSGTSGVCVGVVELESEACVNSQINIDKSLPDKPKDSVNNYQDLKSNVVSAHDTQSDESQQISECVQADNPSHHVAKLQDICQEKLAVESRSINDPESRSTSDPVSADSVLVNCVVDNVGQDDNNKIQGDNNTTCNDNTDNITHDNSSITTGNTADNSSITTTDTKPPLFQNEDDRCTIMELKKEEATRTQRERAAELAADSLAPPSGSPYDTGNLLGTAQLLPACRTSLAQHPGEPKAPEPKGSPAETPDEGSSTSGSQLSIVSVDEVGDGRRRKKLVNDVHESTVQFISAKEKLRKKLNFNGHFYSDFPSQISDCPYFWPPVKPFPSVYSNPVLPGKAPPPASTSNSKEGTHLIVCVHGLDGNSTDLRLVRTYLELAMPDAKVEFLMSERNQVDTFSDFEVMTDRLVQEILYHIDLYGIKVSRISFVGHSLGNLIIRSAMSRPQMAPLLPKLHTFLSLSGPHLGTLFNSSGLVNMGMWLMQKWKKSGSLLQLSMKDHSDLRQTFLYKLSQKTGLEFFKNILLVGSQQDRYVPYHSSRIEMCKAALKDSSSLGAVYEEMVKNILHPIIYKSDINFIRYDVFHSLTGATNSLIGRAAHIAVLDSELFIEKFVTVAALKYFL